MIPCTRHDGQHRRGHRPLVLGRPSVRLAWKTDSPGYITWSTTAEENVLGVASGGRAPDGEAHAFAEVVEAGIEMGSAGLQSRSPRHGG